MTSTLIEEVVFSRLTTFADLAAMIETRAYPLVVPQNVTLPALAYQTISSRPRRSMTGPSGLTMTRMQITTVANDYLAAKLVDQQVRAAFNAVSFVISGVTVQGAFVDDDSDDYDTANLAPEAAPIVRTDVILWHTAL